MLRDSGRYARLSILIAGALVAPLALPGCGLLGDRPPVIRSTAAGQPDPRIAIMPEIVMPTGDGEIVVGMAVDSAMAQFPQPEGASLVTGMPLTLKDPPFSAKGWQSPSQGFGVISIDGSVVLAVRRLKVVPKSFVEAAVAAQQKASAGEPPVMISDDVVSYFFWERTHQRVMISAVELPDKHFSLTWAIGDISLMDHLHMNMKDAQSDMVEARKIREGSNRNGPKPGEGTDKPEAAPPKVISSQRPYEPETIEL